ncbi:hypothetical protein [Sphingomonas arenae]|uniref:hypothetical protein n=1 Tax=Sphingomonas arenae TaxID=2812555 RepID=UPI001967739C|nr:hypothetical protein [Sphingomonas arenae]
MKALLPLFLLLTGCSDDRPPAPTAEENRRLDEAEAMLNGLNEEGPAPEGTGPSNSSD